MQNQPKYEIYPNTPVKGYPCAACGQKGLHMCTERQRELYREFERQDLNALCAEEETLP